MNLLRRCIPDLKVKDLPLKLLFFLKWVGTHGRTSFTDKDSFTESIYDGRFANALLSEKSDIKQLNHWWLYKYYQIVYFV